MGTKKENIEVNAKHQELINSYFEDEVTTSYLNYAYSVITGRAIPDVYDGIKPVQRRILYAMSELGLWHDKPTKKSARIIGEVLGKYHPHGDSSVYMAMAKMAQDFVMRYPLVIGQGNFGSIDDDPPAAMRYTEAKLSKIAEFLLEDIDKNTVEFKPNFDDTLKEPKVLPGKFPNLLCNGTTGIAVGLATDIPPHNFNEVAQGIIAYIKNPNISVRELFNYIKGPDFPTGGVLVNPEQIYEVYEKGYGTIDLYGKIIVEEKALHKDLIITEIPYRVVKSKLVEEITNLVINNQSKYNLILRGIKEIRDESNKNGIRIVIELFKDANIEAIKTALYEETSLRTKIKVNMTALVKNHPRLLNLKDLIFHYVDHRRNIIIKRTQFDLDKALQRIHIVDGLIIAIDNIDEVIQIIKKSKDTAMAKEQLIKRFKFTEIQADAILDMKLQKLTNLEITKLKEEKIELEKLIENLKEILNNPSKRDEIIVNELNDMSKAIGDERKTKFESISTEKIDAEDLISNDPMFLTVTKKGFIVREIDSLFKTSSRNTKGRKNEAIDIDQFEKDDYIFKTVFGYLKDTILFVTDQGRVYSIKGYEIKGDTNNKITRAHIKNIERLEEITKRNENITAVLMVDEFKDDHFIMFVTKKGKIAKINLTQFQNISRIGINGIKLNHGDNVVSAVITDGSKKLFIVKRNGKGFKFDENLFSVHNRNVSGEKGTTVSDENSEVIGMDIADENKFVVFITKDGRGRKLKPSDFTEFSNRGGKGYKLAEFGKSRVLADFTLCSDSDLLVITTKNGRRISIEVNKIGPNLLKLIDLNEQDEVSSILCINNQE